ncbi:MAG: DNA starvation/stationary phase protection protein Dps [Alphaproteobacteria bacterium 16-39-46]|nr:MAG: DNA starvation/stationary phase protection protein Dps [Alphaproteobacteria bacterium 16-39-46]OZA44136.1 MAG: DNA starvation/stationary phase protection protein Dps [Alphaproteobacteria bacterium 17-39-52]HQS83519.1 DNA starvation/stationary phase protection protein Dps [Alphaproteobacteria bacterium]HQS93287.1 DNA starvation/stationary phase protection protein Dps [Alphaproteobacteria bacterium]
MHKTFNDLPLKVREHSIQILGQQLADSFDLYSQIKQAHWTVRGPDFIALHELFDSVASHVLEAVDLIAERIQQLGGTARGTVRVSAQKSSLSEYPLTITVSLDHVTALSKVLSQFAKQVRSDIDLIAPQDTITADMLTEIMRNVDKDLWFIESHLKQN